MEPALQPPVTGRRMVITPKPPFDLRLTLRFALGLPPGANHREKEPLLDHFEEEEFRRAVRVDGKLVLYGVREEPGSGGSRLRVRILAGADNAAVRRSVLAAVQKQFSTSLDLAPFYRLAKTDPVLSLLARHFRGMRIPQSGNIFECLVSAILEQQVNLTFAHKVKWSLIRTYGSEIVHRGRSYAAFPEPAALSRTSPAELRKLQISGPKARYITGISQAVQDGSLDLKKLAALPATEARAELLKLKGVGPWTAHYVGLRALGHLDSLPAADVGLQKAIQRFYGLRKPPIAQRVERIGKAWAGWRSYGTFYLWLTFWETPEIRTALLMEAKRRRESARL